MSRPEPGPARPVTFVVGTGRSGSTALTRILHGHPDVLSLNELLAVVHGRAFGPDPVDGAQFWRVLADPQPVFNAMIRSGAAMPELLYHRKPGRFRAETGIPAICLMPLPALSEDPDGLFDELSAEIAGWPRRYLPEQWTALFDWLCRRFGRQVVVERSGFSLGAVPALRAAFPHARFVHLYRRGPDCALSMSRHPGYRLIMLMIQMAAQVGVAGIGELRPEHRELLPPDLAPLLGEVYDPALVLERAMDLADFGALWSQMVTEGQQLLAQLPGAVRMELRYESLLADPAGELARLADFAGFSADPDWLARCRAALDPGRLGATDRLDAAQRQALERACAPGMRALGLAG